MFICTLSGYSSPERVKLKGCVHTCRKTLVNVQFPIFHAKYTTQLGILATFTPPHLKLINYN